MKKLLFFISLFLCFSKVYAVEDIWTNELIDDSSFQVVDAEIRYRWYKELSSYSDDYYIEGENDSLYPYINYSDVIKTAFTEWSDVRPISKTKRTIEMKSARRFRLLKPIRYLFIDNVYNDIQISELEVFANNEKIDVSIGCEKCSPFFETEVVDGIYRAKSFISNGGRLFIDLGKLYGIERIKLVLYIFDANLEDKRFTLFFSDSSEIYGENFAFKDFELSPTSITPSIPDRYELVADTSYIFNMSFNDWVYSDWCYNTNFYSEMQYVPMYRYQDTKYRYYSIDRIYLDGYHSIVDDLNYLKDPESAKIFYLYKNIAKEEEKDDNANNIGEQTCVESDDPNNHDNPDVPDDSDDYDDYDKNDNTIDDKPVIQDDSDSLLTDGENDDKSLNDKIASNDCSNINHQFGDANNSNNKAISSENIITLLSNYNKDKVKNDIVSNYIINHVHWFAKFKLKSLILWFIILLLLIFVVWCYRHHNLSYQK